MAAEQARSRGEADCATDDEPAAEAEGAAPPDLSGFQTGMYGTQRQTVLLVHWDGNVTYYERALWDGNGNPIERGRGDVVFRFKIEETAVVLSESVTRTMKL